MEERPFSYCSYALQENTSAVLALYTRDLKSFVSHRAGHGKKEFSDAQAVFKHIGTPNHRPEQRKMQDA
ncbi:hypothetical protein [Pseudomonas sp. AF03-9]|jgi:hypothetical protein|uniref:hypothetical protein n=1 Tax=Pseudomonas sp. AF03-9 TaxID=2849867 RepID=UPI001CFA3DC0|nr:hypothetical protein [Pseudomonas sp. AF03-9]